jgi:hypothetical protein
MWGQIYFGGLVKAEQTTLSGSLAKLVWTACILKYHNRFCIAKTFDNSNESLLLNLQKICDIAFISVNLQNSGYIYISLVRGNL